MNVIPKNIHLFLILYGLWLGFSQYEIKDEELVRVKDQTSVKEAKLTKIKTELGRVKQFKKDLEKSKQKIKEVVESIESIQRKLPSTINDAEVIQTLTDFSKQLRILKPEPVPLEEENNKFYFTKPFKFAAQGTYLQFLIFFEKLEKEAREGRILNVRELTLKESALADPRSRFKILEMETIIEAYRYNSNFDVKNL